MGARVSARRAAGTLAGAAAMIGAVTVISRILGLGRWLVFSHSVGGTCVGEAYATANQLPNVLYEVAAGGALSAIVIPLVSAALADDDFGRADRIASALLTWALVTLVPLSLALAALARPLAQLMIGRAGAACPGQIDDTARMVVLFAPQVALYGVGIVLTGILQAHRRFLAAAIAPVLSSLVVIVAYLGYGQVADAAGRTLTTRGLWWLAGGTTAGVVALSLPLLIPVRRTGVRLRPTLHLEPAARRRAVRLAASGIIALLAQQAAVLATVWLANHRGTTGTVNAYNYLQAVYLLPYAVLAVPIATSAFPRLTDADGAATLARTIGPVAVAGALGAALVAGISGPVGAFFAALDAGRQGAGRSAMQALAPGMLAFAPGLVGFGISALALRALYARGRAVQGGTAMAAGWLIGAGLPYLVTSGRSAHRTLVALGIGSSIGMTLAGLLLIVLVRRDWGTRAVSGIGILLAKVVPVALAAALIAWLSGRVWNPQTLASACAAAAVGAILVVGVFAAGMRLAAPTASAAVLQRIKGRIG